MMKNIPDYRNMKMNGQSHHCICNTLILIYYTPRSALLEHLMVQGRRDEKRRTARKTAKQQATLEQANKASVALLAAELAEQSRYKSKEFVVDSDPDATDIET
jgi:hypothetical protein